MPKNNLPSPALSELTKQINDALEKLPPPKKSVLLDVLTAKKTEAEIEKEKEKKLQTGS